MAYTDENRFAAIDTPLGPDMLLLAQLKGREGLSRLFSFELSLLSENHNIAFKDIVGQNVTVSIMLADGSQRFFNGIISCFSQKWTGGGAEGGSDFSLYTASMVPWLWLLTRSSGSRIFQGLSVPQIVERIFQEKGFSEFRIDLDSANSDKYPVRDYCVQYRETDFNFISRLLEDEGIYYFFEHEEGKHTLVLADGSIAHKPCPGEESVRYQYCTGSLLEEDVITDLSMKQEIRSGKYSLNDFNFELPQSDLNVSVDAMDSAILGPGGYEIYDYPGLYLQRMRGERLSTLRMEEEEAQVTTIAGIGDCRAFSSGFRFTLTDYCRDDMNDKSFLLTFIEHHVRQALFDSLGYAIGVETTDAESVYENRFECIPSEVQFRPRRISRKPVVKGSQTAIVVGPEGEKIYTDNHGRVKVRFHWDREGKNNENSSCWIRVSQAWAGQGWGAMHIPHVGHEVVVDFLEGDPDRPLITGRVYHGTNTAPEALPNDKYKSIWRDDYGNELIFDATPGDEHIRLHSPHHNSTIEIGKSIVNSTDSDNKTVTLAENKVTTIGATHELFIGAKASEFVGGQSDINIGVALNAFLGFLVELSASNKLNLSYAGELNFSRGYKYTYCSEKEINENTNQYVQHAEGDIKLDSEDSVILVGGPQNSGILKVGGKGTGGDKNEIALSFRKGKKMPNAFSETRKAKAKMIIATIASAVASVVAAGTAATGAAVSTASLSSPDHTTKTIGLSASVATSAAILGAAGIASIAALEVARATTEKETKAPKHEAGSGKPDSKITVDKEGVRLEARKGAQIIVTKSQPQIWLEADYSRIQVVRNGSIFIENSGADTSRKTCNINLNARDDIKLNSSKGVLEFQGKSMRAIGNTKLEMRNFQVLP